MVLSIVYRKPYGNTYSSCSTPYSNPQSILERLPIAPLMLPLIVPRLGSLAGTLTRVIDPGLCALGHRFDLKKPKPLQPSSQTLMGSSKAENFCAPKTVDLTLYR